VGQVNRPQPSAECSTASSSNLIMTDKYRHESLLCMVIQELQKTISISESDAVDVLCSIRLRQYCSSFSQAFDLLPKTSSAQPRQNTQRQQSQRTCQTICQTHIPPPPPIPFGPMRELPDLARRVQQRVDQEVETELLRELEGYPGQRRSQAEFNSIVLYSELVVTLAARLCSAPWPAVFTAAASDDDRVCGVRTALGLLRPLFHLVHKGITDVMVKERAAAAGSIADSSTRITQALLQALLQQVCTLLCTLLMRYSMSVPKRCAWRACAVSGPCCKQSTRANTWYRHIDMVHTQQCCKGIGHGSIS